MFSDLECDYINPIDLCNKLNSFVLPEMLAHAFLSLLFLLSGQWTALILNAPLVAFNVQKAGTRTRVPNAERDNGVARYVCKMLIIAFSRILNKNHMYDATEIFRTLGGHKKECFIKLGFYLVSFFYYLYRMIVALIS
ncbi:hypothetical protein FRB99_001081, partial [Tulasnella sp. 403]